MTTTFRETFHNIQGKIFLIQVWEEADLRGGQRAGHPADGRGGRAGAGQGRRCQPTLELPRTFRGILAAGFSGDSALVSWVLTLLLMMFMFCAGVAIVAFPWIFMGGATSDLLT